MAEVTRETIEYDVCIVGAGPAGLSAAIRLKQLAKQNSQDIQVCIVEKGSEVGAHILSGAVIEPRALNELLPDWFKNGAPVNVPVKQDRFVYLSPKRAWRLPIPPDMKNHGNYIISLGNLCRWLATHASALGVDIFPGFSAVDIIDNNGTMSGIITGDMGRQKNGQPGPQFQPGINLRAKHTLIAEGSRGSLAEKLMARYQLRKNVQPQTYAIGLKELWTIDPKNHRIGEVLHTIGWPLKNNTYGGSFIYHLDNHQLAIGFVIGLDYPNPWLNPYEEFQRFKTHPRIKPLLEGGHRIAYGARALNEGGWQSIPDLVFAGGSLIGCSAGFLNVAKIKGSHTAMKSGMLAAEAVFKRFKNGSLAGAILTDYPASLKKSWIAQELKAVRNIRPGFRYGLWAGLALAAIDTYILRGYAPWTLGHDPDHASLQTASKSPKIDYPAPDGVVSFDKMSSIYLAGIGHEENQPVHLHLDDMAVPVDFNLPNYQAPEQRYCPAGVYEILTNTDSKPYLQINAQNCVHCKTCDIKDIKQNITWAPPQGGSGPNYPNM